MEIRIIGIEKVKLMFESKIVIEAIQVANDHSGGRRRKALKEPALGHYLSVCSHVLSFGGTPEEAAAAVLHDSIEDDGYTEAAMRSQFGDKITDIVLEVTEDFSIPLPVRKRKARDDIATMSASAQLVRAADILNNLETDVYGCDRDGEAFWDAFSSSPVQMLIHYDGMIRQLIKYGQKPGTRYLAQRAQKLLYGIDRPAVRKMKIWYHMHRGDGLYVDYHEQLLGTYVKNWPCSAKRANPAGAIQLPVLLLPKREGYASETYPVTKGSELPVVS